MAPQASPQPLDKHFSGSNSQGHCLPYCKQTALSYNHGSALLRDGECAASKRSNGALHSIVAGQNEQGASEAWYRFTELSLIAFTRHYFKAVASIVEQVEKEIFGEGALLKESTIKAVIDCLHI